MNCCKRKRNCRRTKGLFTFPNEEHGYAPRGCGNEAAAAMAFPITSDQSRLVASSQRFYVHTESSQTCPASVRNMQHDCSKKPAVCEELADFGSSNFKPGLNSFDGSWTHWTQAGYAAVIEK